MLDSYLRFRLHLARHALLQFVASLQSSLEYILLAFAPVMLGLFACIALPGLFAATLPWPQALGLFAAQTLLASAPVYLLRKRLHPAAVLTWSLPLPIAPRSKWSADALVAGMLVGPLSLAYAASTAIWLYQWPDWLRPVVTPALLLTLASLLLAWLLSTLTLARRARMPAARKPPRSNPPATVYLPTRHAHALPYYWRQLFWLPFWRAENVVGFQQTLLLAGALLSVGAWIWHPPLVPPALWGACTALLTMLLTDRGDKAVAEQITLLRPVAAAWPLNPERLYRAATLFTLLPAATVLAGFALLTLGRPSSGYSRTVAVVWLCAAALAQLAIVALRRLSTRGRVGLVLGAILLLTAIGSELWN
ncbi:hypothetical protein GJ699_10345 [Duganella sp. FT80W]|uniref:Uncharacterized protein n=1 Tax=Duganella guangzhouensis TaxID=2666084 RepID=A0A6I2L1K7_9BURK|nr:hypothetical protein [Duganella guangzhouensis]MRW90386.1 hypothetical protein [Duganella guangzhouensis]